MWLQTTENSVQVDLVDNDKGNLLGHVTGSKLLQRQNVIQACIDKDCSYFSAIHSILHFSGDFFSSWLEGIEIIFDFYQNTVHY